MKAKILHPACYPNLFFLSFVCEDWIFVGCICHVCRFFLLFLREGRLTKRGRPTQARWHCLFKHLISSAFSFPIVFVFFWCVEEGVSRKLNALCNGWMKCTLERGFLEVIPYNHSSMLRNGFTRIIRYLLLLWVAICQSLSASKIFQNCLSILPLYVPPYCRC
jgi:hypothetical protein